MHQVQAVQIGHGPCNLPGSGQDGPEARLLPICDFLEGLHKEAPVDAVLHRSTITSKETTWGQQRHDRWLWLWSCVMHRTVAQGGRPDLKGPLVAELEDQPAAGASPCKHMGPTSPQPPVTGRDCSCMGGTPLVPHGSMRLQQASCSPCFYGLWAEGCAATCPGVSGLLVSHKTLVVMLLGNLQRHSIALSWLPWSGPQLGSQGLTWPRRHLSLACSRWQVRGQSHSWRLRVGLLSSTVQLIHSSVPHE